MRRDGCRRCGSVGRRRCRPVFGAAIGVGDDHGQVVTVVGVLGCVLQRIDGFDDVAALIVIVLPQAAFGVAGFDAGMGIGVIKPMPVSYSC